MSLHVLIFILESRLANFYFGLPFGNFLRGKKLSFWLSACSVLICGAVALSAPFIPFGVLQLVLVPCGGGRTSPRTLP